MNIKKLIREEVNRVVKKQQLLSEIGEATLPPFKYKISKTDIDRIEYNIFVSKNIIYEFVIDEAIINAKQVFSKIKLPDKTYNYFQYEISFDLTRKSENYLIKKGGFNFNEMFQSGFLSVEETLRFMSTAVEIIKDFIKTKIPKGNNHFFFSFISAKTQDSETGRESLYLAYLKKNLPTGWSFKKVDDTYMFSPLLFK